jgi:hypothetical protein
MSFENWGTVIFVGFIFIVCPFICLHSDWEYEHQIHEKLSRMGVSEFLKWQVDEAIDAQTDETGHIFQ